MDALGDQGPLDLDHDVSPVSSVAACTCAIDAAASGSSSNQANTSSSGRPRSASTMVRTDREGFGRDLDRGAA